MGVPRDLCSGSGVYNRDSGFTIVVGALHGSPLDMYLALFQLVQRLNHGLLADEQFQL